MPIYEMKLYGVLYHKEADNAEEAKKKLLREVEPRYKTNIPASHIKVITKFE